MKGKEYSEEYAELILGSNKGYTFEKSRVDPVSRITKRSKPGNRRAYAFRQPTFSEMAKHYGVDIDSDNVVIEF